MSYKDPRIQLALAGFVLFFIAWCVMTAYDIPDTNSLMAFVQKAIYAVGGVLLLLIRAGDAKPEDIAGAVASALAQQPRPAAEQHKDNQDWPVQP